MFPPNHDQPAQTFEVGDVVYTLDDDYGCEWWHNWPGVIRSSLRGGREFLVEFLGVGKPETRHHVLPVGSIQHISDHEVGARMHRIVNHLRVPESTRSGLKKPLNALKKPQPRVPVDLPEDPELDDDDVMN